MRENDHYFLFQVKDKLWFIDILHKEWSKSGKLKC